LMKQQREAVTALERDTEQIIPWVFPKPDGSPIGSFRKRWITACTTAGVPGLLFHDLRRSAVRNLERAGVSRSAAMKLTGHRTESVYRRYAITDSGDLEEAAAKLAAHRVAQAAAEAKREKKVIPFPEGAGREQTQNDHNLPDPAQTAPESHPATA
ncbi:MAG TPA: tyrosine-type recombinase/integrase, partial [Candidatus Cryosericum sp.]|nr:tyrosine-type recombinase/integrase [Candidatus Cryosericum sp.]